MNHARVSPFSGELLGPAAVDAIRKLDPRHLVRNPVMFVVEVGALMATLLWLLGEDGQPGWFTATVATWLWLTVLFGNLAEAVAEGRGKAQAATLRAMRATTTARLADGTRLPASELRRGDRVVVETGEVIPGDGTVVEGIASVDESAITGESAPVIREAGGDRSAVTGGTRVLSDRIVVEITQEPGQSLLDRMIGLVEVRHDERRRTRSRIGLIETHGRAATERLIDGLHVVPRRRVDYRGATLEEMDLQAVLQRRPELCLIDELAHTNAPGVAHQKRYEDIADVLAADIDVYSTLNVQHLESLNDAVHELTGVRVRETVPDRVLAAADEVVLVDLTPEALVQRLREGKVYPLERVPAALNGFFKVENLQALREVALRQVAEDVEAKRLVHDDLDRREERLFGSAAAKPIAERLLALAKLSSASSERVVRRAWRSSQRLGAELDILVVRDPGAPPSAAEREQLESLRRIAAVLGARLLVEQGDDFVDAVVRVARRQGTTYILMGAPTAPRGLGRLAEPVANRLMRALPGIDVRLVAERSASG